MDFSSDDRDGRRFQAAVALSLFIHATGAWAGTAGGRFVPPHLKRVPGGAQHSTVSTTSAFIPEMQLIYVAATGPCLEVPQGPARDSSGQGAAAPAPSAAESHKQEAVSAGSQAGGAASLPDGTSNSAFQPYLDRLRSKLGQVIRPPMSRSSAVVLLHFVLDRSGRVISAALVPQETPTSSSIQEEVLRAVHSAAPFPPPPSSWPRKTVSFMVRVHFQESET